MPIAIFITFRPKNGITDHQCEQITSYIDNKSIYYHIITEKLGHERHLHATIFLKSDKTNVKVFNKAIKKFLQKEIIDTLDDGTLIYVAYRGTTCYNSDVFNNYMAKDDNTVTIKNHLPEDQTLLQPYYRNVTPKDDIKDYQHHQFELAFKEYHADAVPPYLESHIHTFLAIQMYQLRTRRVITEPRKIKNLIKSLCSYMNKTDYVYFHSGVELHPVHYAQPEGVTYTCYTCQMYSSSTKCLHFS